MKSALDKLFDHRQPVLLDGAMATELFRLGWPAHMATVMANLEAPDLVRRVHDEHRAAGAQILLTNTFGVLLGVDDQRLEAARTAVRLAREAAGGKARVAGALAAFDLAFHGPQLDRVVAALVDEGVDLLVFEACNTQRDAEVAIEVAEAQGAGLPAVVCATTTDGGHEDHRRVKEIIALIRARGGAQVEVGLNCCRGPAEALRVAMSTDVVPRWIKPSTGAPGDPVDDHVMAAFARAARLRGARFIGGCCGTTAETLTTMAGALEFVDEPNDGRPEVPDDF